MKDIIFDSIIIYLLLLFIGSFVTTISYIIYQTRVNKFYIAIMIWLGIGAVGSLYALVDILTS